MAKRFEKDLRTLDITVLAFSPLLAGIISNFLNLNFLFSHILFLGVPALYLSYRTQKAILRALVFSALFIIPGIFLDHLAVTDKSWFVPNSLFNFRVFGTVPMEDIVFGFLLAYLIVIFYEHFFDKSKHRILEGFGRFYPYLLIPLIMLSLLLVLTKSSLLDVNYFYLKAGIVFLIITALAFVFKFPKFISIFLKTVPYFFFLGLLEEITALRLGHWEFLGKHIIGWVNIMNYKFPIEELLFYVVLFSVAVITYFEFFDDAKLRKK